MSNKFGGQHIEKTGLNGDYLNAWQNQCSRAYLRKEGQAYHEDPLFVESYREYMHRTHHKWASEMMADANPQALNELDRVVREFNELPLADRMNDSLLFEFQARVHQILNGTQIPEEDVA